MGLSAPILRIEELAKQGATGEYICATSQREIHVYLQRGRVAWATSSAQPLEFARFIKARCRIDDETFRQVIDECRREKLPLGETLVAWRLVTWEDVKAALRHQMGTAFLELSTLEDVQSMFLQRDRFTEYNPELTLELPSLLDDVRLEARTALPTDIQSSLPPRAHPTTDAPPAQEHVELAEHLQRTVADMQWVAVVRGARAQCVTPPTAVAIAPELTTLMASGQVDFIALRSASRSLVGVHLPDERSSLWCQLSNDARYNVALSTLTTWGVLNGNRTSRAAGGPSSIPPAVRGSQVPQVLRELHLILEFGRDVLAAVVLDTARVPVAAVGRSEVAVETCTSLARRRVALLSLATAEDLSASSLGFGLCTVSTREADAWCYGAPLLDDGRASVWVMTARTALHGLGWACLTTLTRGLGRNEYLNPERGA